jgi:hypothetical protein
VEANVRVRVRVRNSREIRLKIVSESNFDAGVCVSVYSHGHKCVWTILNHTWQVRCT